MALGEFELIRRYFVTGQQHDSVALGIGDDCALLLPPAGEQLAVSIDTLVEGTHFLPGTDPAFIARRLLGAATSDLAAMGAQPAWLTLALTLPHSDPLWLEPFAATLAQQAREYGLVLVGGDTTRGPLALSAQVHGFVPPGQALTRRGAKPGDLVCVTGTLGDSRAGLETLLRDEADSAAISHLRQRFYQPEPRLSTGIALRGIATSCIDISDGLSSDLSHILQQSACGARLEAAALPLSDALQHYTELNKARDWALSGGEDFELCFTLPPAQRAVLDRLPVRASVIGEVSRGEGIVLVTDSGEQRLTAAGFDHFDKDTHCG
ncbi:thiamine-phosphate kinase [Marinobacterium jannaschii]|uniref:thiamine-phosphate kinase n=1 Tax=Marinobacterium jannaschii TaxID=64970 RepID=UPI000487CB66|nr:thiamine-phosphate kinase [Marinobacterium jannaschii]